MSKKRRKKLVKIIKKKKIKIIKIKIILNIEQEKKLGKLFKKLKKTSF